MKKLWLDDLRPVPDETWDRVKNYKEFVNYIKTYGIVTCSKCEMRAILYLTQLK